MTREQKADYVFRNGKVVTANKRNEVAETLAVRGREILYVGDLEGAEAYIGERTKIVDLNGRALLPGFIESHIHFTELSLYEGGLHTSIVQAKSISDIREILKKLVAEKKPGQWIFLGGYDQNRLVEKRHLTHSDIDDLTPDNPVCCRRVCCHMSVFNKKAMELAGIDEHTVFENPGQADRDEEGRLTGLFKEGMQAKILGSAEFFSGEECQKAFKAGEKKLHQYGVTSIHDMGSGMDNFGRNVLQEEIRQGRIKLRAYMSFNGIESREQGLEVASKLLSIGPHTGIGDGWYKMGPFKILLDGSTSGPSCWMKEPYSHDAALKGIQNYPDQDEINQLFLNACRQGFQITVHAVGDAAVEQVLEAYEYVDGKYSIKNRRFRIEHCGFVSENNLKRIKKLGVIAVSNPSFLTVNGKAYNRYYGERTETMFPHASYQKAGIPESFGTDCPVTVANPLFSIYGAVNRYDIKNGETCGASQKIDVLHAIRCQTYQGAYASFEEERKGSLEPGKLADLVILSEDILSCAPEAIKDIQVDITMVGGQIVYQR